MGLPDPRGEEELHGRPQEGPRSSRFHLRSFYRGLCGFYVMSRPSSGNLSHATRILTSKGCFMKVIMFRGKKTIYWDFGIKRNHFLLKNRSFLKIDVKNPNF